MSNRLQDNRAITSIGTVTIGAAPASARARWGIYHWLLSNQSDADPVTIGLYAGATAIIGPLVLQPGGNPVQVLPHCDPDDPETWALVTAGVALDIVTTAVGAAGVTSLCLGKLLIAGGN